MKKTAAIALLCSFAWSSHAQVSTLAGKSGEQGYDDVQSSTPTDTRFWAPWGVAIDSKENIWVSDFGAHRIKMIGGDLTSVYTRSGPIGSDPASSAGYADQNGSQTLYYGPSGIAVNSGDQVLIADFYNQCIRKLDKFVNLGNTQGTTTLAGMSGFSGNTDGTTAGSTFNGPIDIAIASNGDLYIADRDNHCIRKISGGMVSTIAGTSGTSGFADGNGTSAKFAGPQGICFDQNGDLLVADLINRKIRKVNVASSPAGKVTTVAGTGGNAVTDGTTSAAEFASPCDVICTSAGVIYVSENGYGNVIRQITGGKVTTVAGKAGVVGKVDGSSSSATFNGPISIALNKKQDKLYIADSGNYSIRTLNLTKLSVETVMDSRISIYPNPSANGLLVIENNDADFNINQVNILNTEGKNIYMEKVKNRGRIQLQDLQLAPGIYMVQLTDGERLITTKWMVN